MRPYGATDDDNRGLDRTSGENSADVVVYRPYAAGEQDEMNASAAAGMWPPPDLMQPAPTSAIRGPSGGENYTGSTGAAAHAWMSGSNGETGRESEGGTGDDNPEVIRAEIEQTRTEMSDTINAIQDKLNPQALMEQAKETLQDAASNVLDSAKDTVRDATVGRVENMVSNVTDTAKDTGGNLMNMVRENPLPAALVGLGLGWLFMKNGSSSNKSRSHSDYGSRSSYARPQMYGGTGYDREDRSYRNESGSSDSGFVEQAINRVKQNPVPAALTGLGLGLLMTGDKDSANRQSASYKSGSYARNADWNSETEGNGLASKVGDVVGNAGETLGSVAGSVKETAGDVAGNVAHTAGDVAGAVKETAGNVAGGTGDVLGKLLRTVGDNPIPTALAGLSLGWLVMQSNSGGQERLEKVSSTVGDVAGHAGDAVGETLGNVADTVKHGAEETQTQVHKLLLGNPLAAGAIALGIGAAIGLAVPETEPEHKLLGPARDKLADKAQTVAHDALEKVQEASETVMQRVEEKATDAQYNIENRVGEMTQP